MRHDLEQNAPPEPEPQGTRVSDGGDRSELGAPSDGPLPRDDDTVRVRDRSRVPALVRAALGCPFA